MTERGMIVVVSGPSGAGKSTVISRLMDMREDVCFSVSVTTRPPRKGEVDGVDYFFISPEEFAARVEAGALLEYAQYVGSSYGTPAQYVDARLAEGKTVILDIEVRGAAQVRESRPDSISVFILPPSAAELERRLRMRATDDEEKIQRRLAQARIECAEAEHYGYIVINDVPERAAKELDSIITAEKCRTAGRMKLISEVLEK